MDKNISFNDNKKSEEHESSDSFELFEPIVEQNGVEYSPVLTSIPNSMSIVTIPEDYNNSIINHLNDLTINDCEMTLKLSQNNAFDANEDNLETTRIESFANSFQNNRQMEEQELLTQKFSLLEKQLGEELNNSSNALLNSVCLTQNEPNSNSSKDIMNNNLENYLKEIKDENMKLKSSIEKNNEVMKQQLKNLKELQSKTNHTNEENKRMTEESKAIIEQLRDENSKLKEQVLNLEAMAGSRVVEELSSEVESLRSKCDKYSGYQKIDVSSELKVQDLSAQLIDAKRTIDALTHQLSSVQMQLKDANSLLESLPIMSSQLKIYERDFKIEEMSKCAALKELEQLEKEVESLKKAKNELEEKLEKGEPFVELAAESEQTGSKKSSYTCPKCWRRFEKFQTIQNHFERCLDEDGLFT